jgi:pseudouridine-5'-phosphate glycosidase/pseudouridine kinase
MDRMISEAIRAAELEGVHGSDNTPFILNKLKELSFGRTVKANRSLVAWNVVRGVKVAIQLVKLENSRSTYPRTRRLDLKRS